jgi:hypothetical protein
MPRKKKYNCLVIAFGYDFATVCDSEGKRDDAIGEMIGNDVPESKIEVFEFTKHLKIQHVATITQPTFKEVKK